MADLARPSAGLTSRHVLAIFLGFFGVVFAVNAYFISVAIGTYSGTIANEPYRKGLKYNERIAAAERQANLGWRDEIVLAPDGSRLMLALYDRDGAPVRGLTVSVAIGRPATTARDVAISLSEVAPGRYETALKLAEPGGYIATVEARDASLAGHDVLYRDRKRLWLQR